MKIYYEAKALERAIDAAPRITPSTKSVLKKIIRSAPVADEVEKLRKERDAAVADIQGVMRNAAWTPAIAASIASVSTQQSAASTVRTAATGNGGA